jgi:hypothetical protein
MALYGDAPRGIGLRRRDVDLDGRTLTISMVRVVVDGRVVTKNAPKSERWARMLPLDATLTAALGAAAMLVRVAQRSLTP